MKSLQNLHADYVGMCKKNPYYTADEVEHAWELACKFYKKQFYPDMLRYGNLKLSKHVAIWDMPEVITCKYACKNCYAVKSSRMYKNTRIMRLYHFAIVMLACNNKKYHDYFIQYMDNKLNEHALFYTLPVIRLHSSGDFFNQEYLNIWLKLAVKHKNIMFYTYTKQLPHEIIDIINNTYENFNIIHSLIHHDNNTYINYGDVLYLKKLKSIFKNYVLKTFYKIKNIKKVMQLKKQCKDNVFVCDYGSKTHHTCMVDCHACLYCNKVIFKQH